MACYHPITGPRLPDGRLKRVKLPPGVPTPKNYFTVTCGQCVGCRLERSRQQAIRIMHEAQCHEYNSFITCTYADEHLPQNFSLDLKHWQDFAKRLRHTIGPFRHYMAGEYGAEEDKWGNPLTKRPHYHACIFGHNFHQDRKFYKYTELGDPLFKSETLDQTWGKGDCVIGNLTFKSAAYTARYVMKKVNGDRAAEHYWSKPDMETGEVHELKPEFNTMSLKPGLGAKWIEKYVGEVYPADEVIINGVSARPPKYYDDYLKETNPILHTKIKDKRVNAIEKKAYHYTNERLRVKERVKEAQIKRLARR